MAFVSRIGNVLKQVGIKHVNMEVSSSNSSLYQAIRSMSSAKLFVGGLSYGTDEMNLRETFAQYGQVMDVRIITDRETGRSRGFVFVSYTSSDEANSALQAMDGKELDVRRLRVNFATEKPRPAYGGSGYSGGGYGGGEAGGYGLGGYRDGSNNAGGLGGGNESGNYNVGNGGDNYFGGTVDSPVLDMLGT